MTIYFGSSRSDIQIRMYDKLSERINNNYNVPKDINFWNRTEVQLRNDRAQNVSELLSTEEDGELMIGETVCGILKHYLRFSIKGKGNNRIYCIMPRLDQNLINLEIYDKFILELNR